jgi:hypothetical protein
MESDRSLLFAARTNSKQQKVLKEGGQPVTIADDVPEL